MEDNRKEEILKMGEVDTYFLIDECGAFIWRMNHDMAHGRIPNEQHLEIQKDILNVHETQVFAVSTLDRFGVDPESAKDRDNGDYWKWYRFWDDWKKGLSDEDWDTINSLMENKESYEKYLPKTTWRN